MPSRSRQQSGSKSCSACRKCKRGIFAKKREREEPEPQIEQLAEPWFEEVAALQREGRWDAALLYELTDDSFLRAGNRPMYALWYALISSKYCREVLAIIRDPRCGIERRVAEEDLQGTDFGSDFLGETPLLMATRAGRNDVVEALLAAGADNNNTALHIAAYKRSAANKVILELDVIESLLNSGACIDAVNSEGYTPLHCAALKGNSATVEALLREGASVTAVNACKHTSLALFNQFHLVLDAKNAALRALLTPKSLRLSA